MPNAARGTPSGAPTMLKVIVTPTAMKTIPSTAQIILLVRTRIIVSNLQTATKGQKIQRVPRSLEWFSWLLANQITATNAVATKMPMLYRDIAL